MKKTLCILSFVLVMALCASAQATYIDFSYMPVATAPTPMPSTPSQGYMAWDNFLYVSPGYWAAAGPGFVPDPATKHNTVMFIGGPWQSVAQGSVTLQPPTPPNIKTFQPISVTLSSGWVFNPIVVTAYCNSRLVGTVTWNLTTTPTVHSFPAQWTNVTQLVFTADPMTGNAVHPQPGSMVIYNLLVVER